MYGFKNFSFIFRPLVKVRDLFISPPGNFSLKSFAPEISLLVFWYLAMFPGRVGYDTKISLELLRSGGSTDWWTGWYWRVLQILSLNGHSVILFASFSYLLTIISFYWVINSLFNDQRNRRILARTIFALPILPVFAMTVQHDIFLLCGFLILFGIELRLAKNKEIPIKFLKLLVLLILLLILTTHQGLVIALYLVVRASIILKLKKVTILVALLFIVVFSQVSVYGIKNTEEKKSGQIIPLLMDIKCVVQDPDSVVGEDAWTVLNSLLPKSTWEKPYRCDEINANEWLNLVDYSKADIKRLAKTYIALAPKNGELLIMAHIARSNYVLPPPFSQVPPNQVNLNFERPIGEGTNVALQSGPPVLHPSVDDPYVKVKPQIFLPLEYLAQIPIFIVNQSSWFWGWGGLWLWPIVYFSWLVKQSNKQRSSFTLLAPLLLLHLTLFSLGISSTPRHVTPSIVIGLTCLISILINQRSVAKIA